jgi:hypothetical protein
VLSERIGQGCKVSGDRAIRIGKSLMIFLDMLGQEDILILLAGGVEQRRIIELHPSPPPKSGI